MAALPSSDAAALAVCLAWVEPAAAGTVAVSVGPMRSTKAGLVPLMATPRGGAAASAVEWRSPVGELARDLCGRIDAMADLRPGWDGEHGRAIADAARRRAAEVACVVAGSGVVADHVRVSPSPGGGVQFVLFGDDGREIELFVPPDGHVVEYVADGDGETTEGVVPPARIGALAEWLVGRTTRPA